MATSARPKPSRNRAPGPIGNANGLIVPQTEPNLGGGSTKPPVKTETPQEAKSWLDRAGELIDKGEIKALAEAKDKLNALIDRGVEASGYNPIAMVAGAVTKAAVTVLAPDNVIDLIPGGKAASGANKARKVVKGVEAVGDAAKAGGKVADLERAGKAGKHAASTPTGSAKKADGAGGGLSTGPSGHTGQSSSKADRVRKNQKDGARREEATERELKEQHPDASVQREQYLRDKDGNIVKDPLTGEARRVDHAVIKDAKVVDLVETTSPTADKAVQIAKENRILEEGGAFIRDRTTGKPVPIGDTPIRIIRRN